MARSTVEIKSAIETTIRTFTSLDEFLFPTDAGGSKISRFNILINAVAIAIFVFESVQDKFLANSDELISSVAVHNTGNTRQKILLFQFGDVITLSADFVPTYAVLDPTKRVVTQAAVVNSDTDLLTIKVAKNVLPTPLAPLSAPELSALQDYYYGTALSQGVGVAGVDALWVNLQPDRLFLEGDVFYFGQFDSATVKTAVLAAITNYLETFQVDAFNGEVFMNRLVDAMQAVDGVSRVNFDSVEGRAQTVSFGSGTTVDPQGTYKTVAGYIIEEDDSGNTWDDKITMVLETLGT